LHYDIQFNTVIRLYHQQWHFDGWSRRNVQKEHGVSPLFLDRMPASPFVALAASLATSSYAVLLRVFTALLMAA
jgi:hypothetical protein